LIEYPFALKTLKESFALVLKLFTTITLSLFVVSNSFSQNGQILNFEKLTINEGLSQGFVYNIAQDDKGFMWFCTPDGLNRYDGYHFKIYRHDDADSFSVSSNLVTQFFIDTHKNAWIGTNDNGLNYFDIPHQRFYHFFRGLTINDIVEDKYQNQTSVAY
jgi:ligand-binding sensor domain-containing protein